MATFHGQVNITPATANDNWTLDAAANEQVRIIAIEFGGESTATTAMRTRTTRSASGVTPTAGSVQVVSPHVTLTNLVTFASTWTTQPTLTAGALFEISWNSHGGVVRWAAAQPDEELALVGAAHISNRNAVGTGVSSYGVTWKE